MSKECAAFQPANRAHALQLAADVESYRGVVEAFVATPADHKVYAQLSRAMDSLRRSCIGVLELSVPYLGLLVAHAELVHARWKVDNGLEANVAEVAERNRRASARLSASVQLALPTVH